MNKACLLPGSRRQRQKNLGDRDMLVPWGEIRGMGGKRLGEWGTGIGEMSLRRG